VWRCIIVVVLTVLQIPLISIADVIYFKDGMHTVCQEEAWEENGEVRCHYQGKIIRYDKADVARIEKTRPQTPVAPETTVAPSSTPVSKTNAAAGLSGTTTGGIQFYDPRRPRKYWTSPNSQHDTLQEAVDVLATEFDRSPEWVLAHMGETNDLAEIRRNLADSLQTTPEKPQGQSVDLSAKAILFYNPRRAYKYWTSESGRYQTLEEAVDALAQEYDRSPQWVETYMGETNDVQEIRRNLNDRKASEAKP
jgi:predicted transcriptional regulator